MWRKDVTNLQNLINWFAKEQYTLQYNVSLHSNRVDMSDAEYLSPVGCHAC